MKKIYTLLLLALVGPAQLRAQDRPDPTRATLDSVFQHLDRKQVPTGFLDEYSLPLVPLDIFNGTLTDSSRTNPDGFRFIYGTIWTSGRGTA